METHSLFGFYVPEWTLFSTSTLILGILLNISAFGGLSGETTPYSKFGSRKLDTIPSKKAMICIYLPSVIICLLVKRPSFYNWQTHFDIIHLMSLFHFSKRVFEVCFVHVYKSTTNAETMLSVMITYTLTTLLDLLMTQQMPDDVFSDSLTTVGIIIFVLGEFINGYHHWLLRKMRTKKDSATQQELSSSYSLPQGGLFNHVIAPHYFGEQLSFLGFILVSQNVVSLTLKAFPFIYLSIRARKTREWYTSNLTDEYEQTALSNRKNLIPFVW
ncbi:3-oxo-5-alpha-steroid 4-dehydrogenase-domain-containing protein [Choanephora cucurbitarum]|nr:3-oxo-5-alpha-steroid 4-dehydrogenase-domain-containing protein [Choanephora cucurbitarum]